MADRPFVANGPGHHHLRHPLRPRDMTTRTAPAAWQWGAPLHAPRHSRGAGVSSSGSPAPSCPQNSSWPPLGAHTHTLCTSVRRSLSGEPRWPALRPSAAAGRGPDPAQADASRSLTAEWDPEPPDLRWDKRMGVRKGLALDGRPPRAPGTCAGSGDLRGVPLLWPREGGRGRPRLEGAALSLQGPPWVTLMNVPEHQPIQSSFTSSAWTECSLRGVEARGLARASYMIHLQETSSWLPGLFSPRVNVISIKTFWKAEDDFQWAGL